MTEDLVNRKMFKLHGEWFQIYITDEEVQVGAIIPKTDRGVRFSKMDISTLLNKQSLVQHLVGELARIDQEIADEIQGRGDGE
jgi:hypothetical protein